MSPEQVEGRELDARSDIFSLGTVLYEMVTGQKAFEGKSQLSVASAILEKEPAPIASFAPLMPQSLDHAIRRCLAKNRDERWQTALDLSSELKWIRESGSQAAPIPISDESKKKQSGQWLPWTVCAVLALALIAAMWLHRGQAAEQTAYFSAALSFPTSDMAIAPNGHTVAIVGSSETERSNALWLYEVGAQQATKLANTNGAAFPFWSPDGKFVAFFADGKLKRLDVTAGTVQVISDAPTGRGGTWNQDGVIVFTPNGGLNEGLYRVPATGGSPTRITSPDTGRGENSNRWPSFLPDGKHFLYFAGDVAGLSAPNAIYVGALGSNEKKFVTKADANAIYVAPGYLLYYRDRALLAQPFDVEKLQLSGEAVPLLTHVAYVARIARAIFSASDRVLVSRHGSGTPPSTLQWFDRKGTALGAVGNPDIYANVSLSPDGKSVALDKTDPENENTDVWTYDLQRNSLKRLTFDPAIDTTPMFSPDGTKVLFATSRDHRFKLFVKDADGATEEKPLNLESSDQLDCYPSDWSKDSKYILFKQATELWIAAMPDLKTDRLCKDMARPRMGSSLRMESG